MASSVLRTEHLTKDFRSGFWRATTHRALDDLSIDVPAGAVFGLLGPNGAGKSTTLNLLLNFLRPTSGTVHVLDRPAGDVNARRRIGFLAENPTFYGHLTPEQLLVYFAGLFGFAGDEKRRRVNRSLDRVGIEADRRRPIREHSKGMLQRVGIAQSLLNDPELLILDEPMSGLDPFGRRMLRELIQEVSAEGRTVLLQLPHPLGCRTDLHRGRDSGTGPTGPARARTRPGRRKAPRGCVLRGGRPMIAHRIALVALHVFFEHVRDRAVYLLAACVLLLGATALVAGPLSAGEQVKVVKDVGLALAELAGALMAVVVGVNLIAREIERRTIVSVLSKPLPRWEFIVGEYAGSVVAIAASVGGMGVALFAVLAFMNAVDARLALALVMIAGELALLTAVALFFSVFSSSVLVAVVLTVGVFVAGQLSGDLRSFGDVAEVPSWVAASVAVIGWALPDFSSFDVKARIVHGEPIGRDLVLLTLTYGALYAAALVAGAVAIFARREFR